MTVVAVVPARGGSKGIPRKNLADLGGKPLVRWTIDAALESHAVDRVIVTSEDAEILAVAEACGARPHERPAALAGDEVHSVRAVIEVLEVDPAIEPTDRVVMLLPTSPLRSSADIASAVAHFEAHRPPAVISVTKLDLHAIHLRTVDETGALVPFLGWDELTAQRQGQPDLFALNGSIYVSRVDRLLADRTFHVPGALAFEMPRERSLDIDTPDDLAVARRVVAGRTR